jgi:hypothetical protein
LNSASNAGEGHNETGSRPVPRSASDASSGRIPHLGSDLISALTGRDANRDRDVALRTRRVVLSSRGVLQEQRQDKSRARTAALAIAFLILLLIAPLVWEATDSLIAGEHLGDPGSQLSIWACIVCSTLLGAALIAGWWRKRS